jgi:hypothetical protein
MIKSKIELAKKNPILKIQYKNTKDTGIMKIDVKSVSNALLNETVNQLSIIQSYIALNISENDEFLSAEPTEKGLKYYANLFDIISYNFFKLDENKINLRIIGKQESIELFSSMVKEHIDSKLNIKIKESELENLKSEIGIKLNQN